MRQLIILTFIVIVITSFGQDRDSLDVCLVEEPMPSYPGGFLEMTNFIKKNLQYPKDSKHIEGRVFVEFIVKENGSLSDFKVIKGIQEPYNNIALETVKKMPNWIPAQRENKPIRTRITIPIKFNL